MNKGTSLLAALLVLSLGVSAVAEDKKNTWFQQKIKLNPAALTEEAQASPARQAISVDGSTEHAKWDQAPCDTTLETLWGGTASAYYWQQPPNDPFINMLFEMPGDHGGRLEALQVGWYQSGSSGTPDPDFYVWLSDGSFPLDDNPPYQAIAEFHLSYADINWFPYNTEVPAWESGIYFDPGETFHIGFSHAFEPGDTLAILADDGTLGEQRSSGWAGTEWEDYWPYQFRINAIICPSPVGCCESLSGCQPMTEIECLDMAGTVWYPPPYECVEEMSCQAPCGDCNLDGIVNLSDAITGLNYLFKGASPAEYLCLLDVTYDHLVDIGDVVYLLNYLFKAGPLPCPDCCAGGTGKAQVSPGKNSPVGPVKEKL